MKVLARFCALFGRGRVALSLALAGGLLTGVFVPISASAAETLYYVNGAVSVGDNSDCDHPGYTTIQAAVAATNAAAPADGVIFVCAGTYTVPNDGILVTEAVTIRGASEASVTVTPTTGQDPMFIVGDRINTDFPTVTFEGLTIDGSVSAGTTCHAFLVDEQSTLALDSVTVRDAFCEFPTFAADVTKYGIDRSGGAGILALERASVYVDDSTFSTNEAEESFGGAIAAIETNVVVRNSKFQDNGNYVQVEYPAHRSFAGGAIAMLQGKGTGSGSQRALLVKDSWFDANFVEAVGDLEGWLGGVGGAIYAEDTAITIEGAYDGDQNPFASAVLPLAFSSNLAWLLGGAIYVDSDSSLTVRADATPDVGDAVGIDCPYFQGNGTLAADSDEFAAVAYGQTKGGAVYAEGPVTVECGIFANNGQPSLSETATSVGGAIYMYDATLSISPTHTPDDPDTVPDDEVFEPVFFLQNSAVDGGGAIAGELSEYAAITLAGASADPEALMFLYNVARDGAAILAESTASAGGAPVVAVDNAAFYLNNLGSDTEGDEGGAISVRGDDSSNDISLEVGQAGPVWFGWGFGAEAPAGYVAWPFIVGDGGLEANPPGGDPGDPRLMWGQLFGFYLGAGNGGTGDGAAIRYENTTRGAGVGHLWVAKSVFANNEAYLNDPDIGGKGGAIAAITSAASDPAEVLIERSTFTGNRAAHDGGAVYATGGEVEVIDSTFVDNIAGGFSEGGTYHGAAVAAAHGRVTLIHVTLGGQVYASGADDYAESALYGYILEIYNSIVDESADGERCIFLDDAQAEDSVFVTDSCLATVGPGSVETTHAAINLQPLAANGGPTPTMALGPDSTAIDFADSVPAVSVDQRGAVRPYADGSLEPIADAGAYEAQYTVTSSQVNTTGEDPVPGTALDVPEGETVDDIATVEGYLDLSGFYDPSGEVRFSYCYDDEEAPDWETCASGATEITTIAIEEDEEPDGVGTAALEGWDPADDGDGEGPGYYLFHAEFISDGGNFYEDSEDDEVNESFTYGLATGIATTTTTRVSRTTIAYGSGLTLRDVATVVADEGTDDPTGDVQFSYCYHVSVAPTTCASGTDIGGPVALSGGSDTTDATATARTALIPVPGSGDVGYYLFHASYEGDGEFDGSEDDGTNELLQVMQATTLIDLSSPTYFASVPGGGTTTLSATLAGPAGCLVGREVTFKRDVDGDGTYETSLGTATTITGGVASITSPALAAGTIYEIEVSVEGFPNCSSAVNTATIVVAGSGDSADGGGHYTLSGTGRLNLGFTVQIKTSKTGVVTATGQMTWHKQGGTRLKGSITGYTRLSSCPPSVTTTGAVCGLLTGTASTYEWDGMARRWILKTTGVGFRITVADGGTATVCVKKTCSTTVRPDWFAMVVPSLDIAGESVLVVVSGTSVPVLVQLKGGSIYLK